MADAALGGAVYSPALTDWIFMVKKNSYMYITGPDVVKAVIAEEVSHDELGGPMAHAAKSGVCHFVTENDEECIARVKTLLSCAARQLPQPPAHRPLHRQRGEGVSGAGQDHPGQGLPGL